VNDDYDIVVDEDELWIESVSFEAFAFSSENVFALPSPIFLQAAVRLRRERTMPI
jgi:hypothetical protein